MQSANNCKHVYVLTFESHLNHGKFYLEIQTRKKNKKSNLKYRFELMTFEIDQLLGL